MRALTIPQFGPAEVLTMSDIAVPEPGPGQVSIDVAYAGLNYAEVLYRRGVVDVPLPFVPGIEVAGHVRAVGEGVSDLTVGQPVVALTIVSGGGYAEVVVTNAALVASLDESIDLAVASCLASNTTTAILIMNEVARVRAGETVLVHAAAGGVGSQLGQVAKMLGAGKVIGTVGSQAKAAAALSFGYDEVIVRDNFVAQIDELTDGHGVDIIVDPVGGPTREASLEALALGGRLIAMGNASGDDDVSVSTNRLWFSGTAVVGFNLAAFSALRPAESGAALRRASAALAAGDVRVDVRRVLPLAQAAEAHRELEEGRTIGKVALAVGTATRDLTETLPRTHAEEGLR